MVMFYKGNGRFDFDIVGESYYQSSLEAIAGPRSLEGHDKDIVAALTFDDCNKYDPKAVAVFLLPAIPGRGVLVGYFARRRARTFREATAKINIEPDALMLCRAKIVGGWDDEFGDSGHFGVKLDLKYPLEAKPFWSGVPIEKMG